MRKITASGAGSPTRAGALGFKPAGLKLRRHTRLRYKTTTAPAGQTSPQAPLKASRTVRLESSSVPVLLTCTGNEMFVSPRQCCDAHRACRQASPAVRSAAADHIPTIDAAAKNHIDGPPSAKTPPPPGARKALRRSAPCPAASSSRINGLSNWMTAVPNPIPIQCK